MAKRENKLTIRLTPEEYKHFLALQRGSGLSQADFILRAIDKIPIPDNRVYEQYKEMTAVMKELRDLMKNINPNQE